MVKKVIVIIFMLGQSVLTFGQNSFSKQKLWSYQEIILELSSDNYLMNLAASTVAESLSEEISEQLASKGIKANEMRLIFEKNNVIRFKVQDKQYGGTYSYDSGTKKMTLVFGSNKPVETNVTHSSTELALTLGKEQVLSLLKEMSLDMEILQLVTPVLEQYDTLVFGFRFAPQD